MSPRPTPFASRHLLPIALLLALGLALRIHHLATMPVPNETVDEYAWTWAGMTILQEHTPRSWSHLAGYAEVSHQHWRDHEYYLVKPWLDHPPLFAVVMGCWMLAGGYHDMFSVDLSWMRWFSIWLFVGNFLALFALARRYFETDVVLLGLACFALAPLAVVNQKLVVSENFFVLIWMTTQLALFRYIESGRRRWAMAMAVGAFALPLIKIPALGCSLHLALLAAMRRRTSAVLLLAAATSIGLLAVFAWGYHYSPSIFLHIMGAHARRFVGLGSSWQMIWALKMVDHPFFYAPFIFALMSMLLDASDGKAREFYLQYVVYLLCMTFFADERSIYGWYTIPLYPVASMAVARAEMMMIRGARRGFVVVLWILVVVPFLPTLLRNQVPLVPLRYGYLALILVGCGSMVASELGYSRPTRLAGLTLVLAQLAADLYYDAAV